MNCKPGDLCYVVGVAQLGPPLSLALGCVVRVTAISPTNPVGWMLERPLPLVWGFLHLEVHGIEDHYLRPIAGPSVDKAIETETLNPLESTTSEALAMTHQNDGTRRNALPTREEIESILDFDPASGVFTWKHRAYARPCDNARRVGTPAGTLTKKGYVAITLPQGRFMAHVLVWLLFHGPVPDDCQIDHDDTNKANNRPGNLRLATGNQNHANRDGYGALLKGVKLAQSGRFQARIKANGTWTHLGTFDSEIDAHRAYCRAAEQKFGQFARADSRATILDPLFLALGITSRSYP